MTSPTTLQRVQFHAMTTAPFILAILLVASFFGCQQGEPEKKETKPPVTVENLQTAYCKAVNYSHMYELFAARAEKDRLQNIAMLYKAVAASEAVHAKQHADLMKAQGIPLTPVTPDSTPVGSTTQTIKMAISREEIEVGSMYPNLARTAEMENLKEAATQFTHVRDADARQLELLQTASNDLARFPKYPFWVCNGCGFIFNSDKTEECPVCAAKKQTFAKI